jgi:hypothetical protein
MINAAGILREIGIWVVLSLAGMFGASAQTADDFGKITLRSDVSSIAKLSEETKSILTTKLNQIVTNHGIAATGVNPRFVITAKIDVISKDIVAGPPQMFSQKLQVTLFVGDVIEQKLFGNTPVNVTGIGTNETKAYINAINKINPRDPNIKALIEESKAKIVAYYNQAYETILKEARTLSAQGQHDQAIYNLSLIPDVCSGYQKALSLQGEIYTTKIETEGKQAFQQAQALWARSPNKEGASEVTRWVAKINPGVSFAGQVSSFVKQVSATVEAQELREWEQQVREYKDRVKAKQRAMDTFKSIAVEYIKHQPEVINNRIITLW